MFSARVRSKPPGGEASSSSSAPSARQHSMGSVSTRAGTVLITKSKPSSTPSSWP